MSAERVILASNTFFLHGGERMTFVSLMPELRRVRGRGGQ